ncbi:CaiB/BaiF CoA-transferase family protein [Pigmentiphaga sp.]|uniref:CaiB/BaiF CoA transferase family protein n=1 Tax=Pigmentiphaga sp. TaxID=1977564 RepID=UPI0025EF6014|nr:CaiB/BaiF CoA-transferase family protein [Pigmentiphaga sp.]MBX6317160.1 CoA transferase [Pigmentiphaga sp.]
MTCLSGVRVLDLSRVFSGPWAAQMLADFGADVIKVERPGRGDDVRQQGLRVKDAQGRETKETSSYLAMNRGKRSITVDLSHPEGQALIRDLARHSDILIENFKAGDLARYGLDYESLSAANPRLIYCSISGFGQTGPYRHLPGYDPIFQSMSGLMSITGHPDGEPLRVGYSVGDITAGFYAVAAVLAALRHRDVVSGQGQYIDLALLDAQVAAVSHVAMMYLVSGEQPPRLGNASPITCPWQSFDCSDGQIVVAVGNDTQFAAFCRVLGMPELAEDERFSTNRMRAKNQSELVPMLAAELAKRPVAHWQAAFQEVGVPSGPINGFAEVFADPQIQHRQMLMHLPHDEIGSVPQVANPVRFSATPIQYHRAPPLLGQHTDEVLTEVLGLDQATLERLRRDKVI